MTRCDDGLITRRQRGSETLGGILAGGCKRAESEDLGVARQCELVVLGRPNAQRNAWTDLVQT